MNKKNLEKKEIIRWWNYKRQLRWKNIYKEKNSSSLALHNRMQMILKYIQKLKLKKISILEIGFGGGQLAYEIIKKGHKYNGIDVSKKLTQFARQRCKFLPNKNYSFKTGNIEETLKYKKATFDLIIVAGVLQYSLKPNFVFNEIFRVLKNNSTFICAQTNFYKLSHFFYFKSFLIRIFYSISNEDIEISNSLRSLFLETKIKKILNLSIKKKIINSSFFNKGFTKINFKFKKRVFHRKKIINIAKNAGFKTKFVDACGPYLNIGYKKNIFWFINAFIEFIVSIFPLSFLKFFGESQVIIFKK